MIDPAPEIAPPPRESDSRPIWSVMIPTYNCAEYLAQTLQSVLGQDLGPELMQIEVVDDCSNRDDPESVVKSVGRGRVTFYRKPKNGGAIANFNSCIERSRGRYVHILHGDDTVMPGYYDCISKLIARYPNVGLYATRCFYIDAQSVLIWMSPRMEDLEIPSRDVTHFYYECPIQFAGVTVSRTSYESLGGFRADFAHTADLEMWARIISAEQGVVSSEVKANYRIFPGNDTDRLAKGGENIKEMCRLHEIFASRYPNFSMPLARQKAAERALRQYREFSARGEKAAADVNLKLWLELTPFRRRMINYIKENLLFGPSWQS
jgi:glycosyltransferase involved in cell wall biosynthesis